MAVMRCQDVKNPAISPPLICIMIGVVENQGWKIRLKGIVMAMEAIGSKMIPVPDSGNKEWENMESL